MTTFQVLRHQRYSSQEPWVLETEECAPYPCAKKEDDTTSAQYDGRVRRALIRFVGDVELIRNLELTPNRTLCSNSFEHC